MKTHKAAGQLKLMEHPERWKGVGPGETKRGKAAPKKAGGVWRTKVSLLSS